MPMIEGSGAAIHCEQVGRGPDIVWVSGAGGTADSWDAYQVPYFKDRFRNTTYDCRGVGATRCDVPLPWTIEDFARDAADLIRTVCDPPVAIVGLSFGGGIVQQVALDYPELVRCVITMGTGARSVGTKCGLVDTGLEWSVAASGWTSAWRTPAWEAMLSAARAGAFDLLVVGYVSRFLRNLKQTLIAIEDHLAAAGVAVLFADERLLTSDPNNWDQFVREAHEAEAYSRKLSKRVREGYSTKRRRLGVPGGNRAPFGLIREGHPSVLRVDEDRAAIVGRAYALAATGATDREVAAATGLKETHVGEILTNPIYAGRLRTGETAGIAPLVDAGLWSRVQTARERRRTRMPGRIVKRQYALRLRCLGCHRFLYGDVGRYRHPSPTCEAFRAAVPLVRRQRSPAHATRIKGHSYPQAWYEGAIGALLGRIGTVDEATLAEVVRLHAAHRPEVDELALARIDREREAATRKLAQTRDIATWQAAMSRLDAAEALARQPPAGGRLTPPEIVAYLRSLPALWADSGPDARQTMTTAIFARTDVLGFERMEYELTSDAIALGLDAALPAVFELRDQIGEFGRGERDSPATTDLPITIRLAEPQEPFHWLRWRDGDHQSGLVRGASSTGPVDKAVAATGIGYRASRTIENIGGATPAWDSPVSTNPWRS